MICSSNAVPLRRQSSPAAVALHCQPSGTVLPAEWQNYATAVAQFSDGNGRTVPLKKSVITRRKALSHGRRREA